MNKKIVSAFITCALLAGYGATPMSHAVAAQDSAQTVAAPAGARPAAAPAQGEEEPEPLYMPRNVRAAYELGSRSMDGKPGPNYWQNTAVHDIHVTVMPPSRTVSATQVMTYTNNSRDYLARLPVRLYMNSRLPEAQREVDVSEDYLTPGVSIDAFSINGVETPWAPLPGSGDTFKVIQLPIPLGPGESVTMSFDWHYELAAPKHEGVVDPTTFFLGYFYPRITPYNDTDTDALSGVPGFDVEEFTYRSGRERFDDFADFNVSVTVPKNYGVWASGELQNANEVLQPKYAQRLEESRTSDKVINIATPAEMKAGQVTTQTASVTWKWKAENITTFGIGLSDHYVWDAGSVVVDSATGRRASVESAYPVEATDYKNMVEDAKAALVFGSTQWPGVPYPYPKTSVFVGGADEEFPMLINDGAEAPPVPGATVRFVAAHELLHSYFPFYMGIDERRYPMLDEGWTTAFEYLFGLQDVGKEQADLLFKAVRSGNTLAPIPGADIPIITPADATRGRISGINAYEKSALGFLALKELMGDEAFKASLQEYIARWNGKHSLPWDMFNTFNETYGQNLNWFWNNWYFEPNHLDLAIENVKPGANGTTVTVKNIGGFAMPFDLVVQYADNSVETFRQTPALWKDSPASASIALTSTKEIKAALLDTGIFMDPTNGNNVWPNVPVADPYAPVIAQVKSADGKATISMTLPAKTQATAPGQYYLPSTVIVALQVVSPTMTPANAIKAAAAGVGIKVDDAQIVAGENIAGQPSKVLRTTANLQGTQYGYDSYAVNTPAGTYQVTFLVPNVSASVIESLRARAYPELLKKVVLAP
jgi:hypothetical protein